MQASPLAELKDIHLPEPTTLWPPAIGWWILLAVAMSLVVIVILWRIRRWRLEQAKRKALSELSQLTSETDQWPQALQQLVRRLTISYFAQEQVAQLHGQQWIDFLLAQLKVSQRETCEEALQALVNAQYRKSVDLDFAQQTSAVKYWISNALPPRKKTNSPKTNNKVSEVHHV